LFLFSPFSFIEILTPLFVDFFDLAEVLQVRFEHVQQEIWGISEGTLSLAAYIYSCLDEILSIYSYFVVTFL